MPQKDTNKPKVLSANLFPVVGIGASAGGLDAFKRLILAIPEKSGMAYIFVQHLDPHHDSVLPELLQRITTIPIHEITDNIHVEPDHIYIIPSNKLLVATDGVLQLSPRPSKNRMFLSIDAFFSSLAEVHGPHAIGIVLSGTGTDGTLGLKAIKDQGGITMAQDAESAAYDGMPASATKSGMVDFVLPPEAMPEKLLRITNLISRSDEDLQHPLPAIDQEYKEILAVLRLGKGTDFTYYKQTTIRRRILRRMAINKIEEPAAYLKYLVEVKEEQDILYGDLLIPVTGFFRDPKVFSSLSATVFPGLIKDRSANGSMRIWVAGCSTGEEAYSMAICLYELLQDEPVILAGSLSGPRFQIFATDISEPAIAKARAGVYTKAEVSGLSAGRLKQFFTESGGKYGIIKSIRDLCVFAVHNFLKDPPFAKLDLVSCRNVLIYMEPYLQRKALQTFHYALNPDRFLLLGKSEASTVAADLFTPGGKQEKLYVKKDAASGYRYVSGTARPASYPADMAQPAGNPRADFQKTVDDILLSRYTPAGVVVNEAMDIVHFRGGTGPYLEPSPGKASLNLLKMARDGLSFELRNILHKAKTEHTTILKEDILLKINGVESNISIEAVPLPNAPEPHYLVLFHNNSIARPGHTSGSKKVSAVKRTAETEQRFLQLEQQLNQAREDMRTITEDQEAANEELLSSNEELLSSSVELQSLNEQLETSKEELQSCNEELTVVNQEMVSLNEQIAEARNYAEAIVTTIAEPLVVMDKGFIVKSANSAYYNTFGVDATQTEGCSFYELGEGQWDIPALRLALRKILPGKTSFANMEISRNFPGLGERIFRLNARVMTRQSSLERLILLAMDDITESRMADDKLKRSEERFCFLTNMLPQKVWTISPEGTINYINRQWLEYTGLSLARMMKKGGIRQIMHPDDWPEYIKAWKEYMANGTNCRLFNRFRRHDGEYRWHQSKCFSQKDESGALMMWVGTSTDVHDQKIFSDNLEALVLQRTVALTESNKDLKETMQNLEEFAFIASHDLQEPLRKIQTFANRLVTRTDEIQSDSTKVTIANIARAADRMRTLIDDLLRYSALSAGDLFEKTDLNDILKDVLVDLELMIEEKQAVINCGPLPVINAIPLQMNQLFYNLIHNALKFSREDTLPVISVTAGHVGNDKLLAFPDLSPDVPYLEICVTDNGIGFDGGYADKIFSIFQRLNSPSQYEGTGIGLAICRKIALNHRGEIHAISTATGASFHIFLPMEERENGSLLPVLPEEEDEAVH